MTPIGNNNKPTMLRGQNDMGHRMSTVDVPSVSSPLRTQEVPGALLNEEQHIDKATSNPKVSTLLDNYIPTIPQATGGNPEIVYKNDTIEASRNKEMPISENTSNPKVSTLLDNYIPTIPQATAGNLEIGNQNMTTEASTNKREGAEVEITDTAFEDLLSNAFSGTSKEAARELLVLLTTKIEAHERNLDSLAALVANNPERERTLNQFRIRETMLLSMKNSIEATLLDLAAGDTLDMLEIVPQQDQDIARNIKKFLDMDETRLHVKFADLFPGSSVEEQGLPEDNVYNSLREEWKSVGAQYEAKQKEYEDALRAEFTEKAKGPLSSLVYALQKAGGLTPRLSEDVANRKREADAAAKVFRDTSNALMKAKRDAFTMKFGVPPESTEVAEFEGFLNTVKARHDKKMERTLLLDRARRQVDIMKEVSSLADRISQADGRIMNKVFVGKRMKDIEQIIDKNKTWMMMGGVVGIGALAGGLASVVAAVAGGTAVRNFGGKPIEALLKRRAEKGFAQADFAAWKDRVGFGSYEETLKAYEAAMNREAERLKAHNFVRGAAFATAVAAGGLTSYAATPDVSTLGVAKEPVPVGQLEAPVISVPEAYPAPVRDSASLATVDTLDSNIHAVQPGDTLWDIFKNNLQTPSGKPTDTEMMGFRNYLAENPVALENIGIHTNNPDIVRPGIDSVDIQKMNDIYQQFLGSSSTAPEEFPAQELPIQPAENTDASQVESGALVAEQSPTNTQTESVATPFSKEEAALAQEINDIVKNVETFTVEKRGFLGLWNTQELQSTNGTVFKALENLTLQSLLDEYHGLEANPVNYRSDIFPQGVSQAAINGWANFVENNNEFVPATINLTLGEYVTKVAQNILETRRPA